MEKNLEHLIKSCQSGNTESFSRLCEKYYDAAYRLAFRMLCNEEDAADITQESFIKIWKHITKYNFSSQFSTWMYTIVSRLCIDTIRKRRPQFDLDCNEVLQLALTESLDKALSNKDLAEIITAISRDLSPRQRQIFTLRDLEGLDINSISEITGMHPKNVKSNLCHARRAVRETLKNCYKTDFKSE